MRTHLGFFLLAVVVPSTLHAARSTRGVEGALAAQRQVGTVADDSTTYRNAQQALNDGNYQFAAGLFRRLRVRLPGDEAASSRWPDAGYWEAFALYRIGNERSLRDALAALNDARRRFPSAATSDDAATLATRIRGALARGGDPDAAASLVAEARGDVGGRGAKGDRGRNVVRGSGRAGSARDSTACRTGRGDDAADGNGDDESADARIAALNALMQMNAEQAVPILRQVLARRDACTEGLRRKAVFLVAQQNTPESADMLLGAARNDPDPGVRQQAIFWLSQVHSDRAVGALDSILRSPGDAVLRERAIFALSQQHDPRARRTLRDFAKSDAPVDLRRKAVFWLGQQDHSAENAAFLRSLFDSPGGAPLRDEIIQAAASAGAESDAWLFSVARDPKQDVEQRKRALFWLGQQRRVPVTEFVSLYDKLPDREIKEQLLFVLSQRHESAAVDKLFDVARHDGDPALRGKALFWLGQSNDPRVQQLLMEIIDK